MYTMDDMSLSERGLSHIIYVIFGEQLYPQKAQYYSQYKSTSHIVLILLT